MKELIHHLALIVLLIAGCMGVAITMFLISLVIKSVASRVWTKIRALKYSWK